MKPNAFLGWLCLVASLLVFAGSLTYAARHCQPADKAAPQEFFLSEDAAARPAPQGNISEKSLVFLGALGFGLPLLMLGAYALSPKVPARCLAWGGTKAKAYWSAPENRPLGLAKIRQTLLYSAAFCALICANTTYWLVEATVFQPGATPPALWSVGLNTILSLLLLLLALHTLRLPRENK